MKHWEFWAIWLCIYTSGAILGAVGVDYSHPMYWIKFIPLVTGLMLLRYIVNKNRSEE